MELGRIGLHGARAAALLRSCDRRVLARAGIGVAYNPQFIFPYDYQADYFTGVPGESPEVKIDVEGGMLISYTKTFEDPAHNAHYFLSLNSTGGYEHDYGISAVGTHYEETWDEALTFVMIERDGPSAVPEPSAVWMLLAGLTGFARRQRGVAAGGRRQRGERSGI